MSERDYEGDTRGLASATRVANAFPDKLTSDLDALRGRPPVVLPPPPPVPSENEPHSSLAASLPRPVPTAEPTHRRAMLNVRRRLYY